MQSLRQAQLRECLSDSKQYKPSTPMVLAGDMNLNVARYDAISELKQEGFTSPFTDQQIRTTPAKSLLDRGSTIDWIFTRGPLRATQPQVHTSVTASDHYPLSLTLSFV